MEEKWGKWWKFVWSGSFFQIEKERFSTDRSIFGVERCWISDKNRTEVWDQVAKRRILCLSWWLLIVLGCLLVIRYMIWLLYNMSYFISYAYKLEFKQGTISFQYQTIDTFDLFSPKFYNVILLSMPIIPINYFSYSYSIC